MCMSGVYVCRVLVSCMCCPGDQRKPQAAASASEYDRNPVKLGRPAAAAAGATQVGL